VGLYDEKVGRLKPPLKNPIYKLCGRSNSVHAHAHRVLAAQQFYKQHGAVFTAGPLEYTGEARKRPLQYFHRITGLMGPVVGVVLVGVGIFGLFEVFDNAAGHRLEVVAKAHQPGNTYGGAHGGEAVLVRVYLNEQVAGEQGLYHFGPFASSVLAQQDFRQVGFVVLALELKLCSGLLPGLGLYCVPVFHFARCHPGSGLDLYLHTLKGGKVQV
jgi:hypothetical protein